MSLTLAKRTLQIFASLGSVSTASLVPSFIGKEKEIKSPKRVRQISSDHREEPKGTTVEAKKENIMEQAVRRMGESGESGEKRCFWLFEERTGSELFMCINMTTLVKPSLFHYSWRNKELKEVIEMTYNGTPTLKMTYDSRGTKDVSGHLRASFAWYRKGEKSFIPQKHCTMKRVGDSTKKYTLTCKDPNNEGGRGLIKEVIPELPSKSERI